jgi:hypothetical protein
LFNLKKIKMALSKEAIKVAAAKEEAKASAD